MKLNLNYAELIKQKLVNLNLKDLVDDDLDILLNVIEQSTVLEKLWLGGNKLTFADGKLANAIAKNTAIKVLNLYNNNISDEGAKHLTDALKENSTLEELYLGGNNIGDEGAKYIAEMLAVNKTLLGIVLNINSISDKGAQTIATSLVVNTGIQRFWLDNNKVTDEGAEKLVEALESNRNIKDLQIVGIDNSNHAKERIEAILNDTKRSGTPQSSLDKLELYIAKKDNELKRWRLEIEKDEKLKGKDSVIAKKDKDLAKKDMQIASLKSAIRGQLQQLAAIIDPVDLTSGEDTEPPKKRVRTGEDTPKSTLAIQHEQNQQYSQRLVKVKQEKSDAETNLENVRVEKQAVEANLNETRADLEDVREDLDIANETVTQVAVFTDRWQSKFDDMKALAEAAGADGAAIAAITNR